MTGESTDPAVVQSSTSTMTSVDNTGRSVVIVAPTRTIDTIILHCAATPNGDSRFDVAFIDRVHSENGWSRKDAAFNDSFNAELEAIGYHYVIHIDGTRKTGRHEMEIGAHVKRHNVHSIGVNMIGSTAFTRAQWRELKKLVKSLQKRYPTAEVKGHNEYANKICPGFEVSDWLGDRMRPLEGHICDPL